MASIRCRTCDYRYAGGQCPDCGTQNDPPQRADMRWAFATFHILGVACLVIYGLVFVLSTWGWTM